MEINDIKKIIYNDGLVEILIGVELDSDNANRWELEDPNALVTYKSHGDFRFDHIELIDKGMKVHGYEFTESEENKIANFLEKKVFKQ